MKHEADAIQSQKMALQSAFESLGGLRGPFLKQKKHFFSSKFPPSTQRGRVFFLLVFLFTGRFRSSGLGMSINLKSWSNFWG